MSFAVVDSDFGLTSLDKMITLVGDSSFSVNTKLITDLTSSIAGSVIIPSFHHQIHHQISTLNFKTSPRGATQKRDIMNLDTLPLEIFEMVIESVSFVDLPYLLQVSKGIHVPPKSVFSHSR